MSMTAPELQSARTRIHAAYSPDLLSAASQTLSEALTQHARSLQTPDGQVLNWNPPLENIQLALRKLNSHVTSSTEPEVQSQQPKVQEFQQLTQLMLEKGHNLQNPRYIGHQVPASVPLAGLFDAIASVTNQVMAVYEMGPWATAVEIALIKMIGKEIGFPTDKFSGLVTHGGSLANLTGLLAARNLTCPEIWQQGASAKNELMPVILASSDAHYSLTRSAGILGIGTENILKVSLDQQRRMNPLALREIILKCQSENRKIIAVIACACATPIGAFDPLNEIADLCEQFQIWLHVDAAHGGPTCFSQHHHHLTAGLHRADSVVFDAHKMMFMPALCAFLFFKDKAHQSAAFQQQAPYLFDPSAPEIAEYDLGLRTIECTKRANSYGLWGVWSLFGKGLFADLVDVTFETAQIFYEMLEQTTDFEPVHKPECNILVFRYQPDWLQQLSIEQQNLFHFKLRRVIIESGEFYIVHSVIDGQAAFRITVMNPLTTDTHLTKLLETIRQKSNELRTSFPASVQPDHCEQT
ncbi:pyridoxal phosphate-dependent decarboxylase family protein [Gimesia aquarii]|uniref:L-2,4-diaminobutyrate decarboxylase n=1 Tax=Gimesia aquarii TaxID=2527964 RepID=A0A517WZ99_9PLAN|nr:pyridoxal-dependent decarboxylase [Gimesia aquarii]QDU10574.1 L-2,4-diaminobutyrate decarboxylase [Gimesia aquarii]